MHLLIAIHFLFILYYGYAFFVFYKLNENTCNCKKLETFKKSNAYRFLFTTSFLFLAYNLFNMVKLGIQSMKGGMNVQNMYVLTIGIISCGYILSFVYDIILLRFFGHMKNQKCPCQVKHRAYLTNITYVKVFINLCIYISIFSKLDKKFFQKSLKKYKSKKS